MYHITKYQYFCHIYDRNMVCQIAMVPFPDTLDLQGFFAGVM